MTDDVPEDLAEELRTRLHRDPHALQKNAGLFERVVLAYIEQGLLWDRCRAVLREIRGMSSVWLPRIKLAAHKQQGIQQIGEPGPDRPRVVDVWGPNAPVSDEAEIPRGWGANGIDCALYQEVVRQVDGMSVTRQMPISYDPIVIRRVIEHEDQRSIMLELVWRRGTRWYIAIYDRDEVFKKNGLVAAAADGAPVGDDNSIDLVRFLRAYENHNLAHIEHDYASSSMGWKGDVDDPTADGFLCGNVHMCRDEDARHFMLKPMGPGDEEEARAIRKGGNFDRWKLSVAKVQAYPAVRIAIYAGLASVMLPILGAPNVIVEWVNRTSTGKTRVLQIVQSLWRSAMTFLTSWDNTVSNLESKAHLHSGLPLFVDDTKAVIGGKRGEEILGRAIYKYINGKGRGRDQRSGGQRSTISWRGVLFSTGETPSSDLAHAEGAAARVLSFWTKPWGESNPETGAMIDSLVEIELAENYGHAGPAFVQWLHEHRDLWPQARLAYDEATHKIRDTFKSPAADRLARVIALLEVTAALAHAADVIPWPPRSLLDDPEIQALLRVSVEQAEVGADDVMRAWEYMMSEVESRGAQWLDWGVVPSKTEGPSAGWIGWRRATSLGWLKAKLQRTLEEGGFNADAIIRGLTERGMIRAGDKGHPHTRPIRVGDGTARVVYVVLDESKWHLDGVAPQPSTGDDDGLG